MRSPLIIRHAVLTDADAISQLIHSVAGFCKVNPSGEGAEMFFSSISAQAIGSHIANTNFLYLLGSLDGKLAGVVAVRDAGHLFHLFVAPRSNTKASARHWHCEPSSYLWPKDRRKSSR